jgi:hypothetical protein
VRVEAGALTDNLGEQRSLEKAEFHREGVLVYQLRNVMVHRHMACVYASLGSRYLLPLGQLPSCVRVNRETLSAVLAAHGRHR